MKRNLFFMPLFLAACFVMTLASCGGDKFKVSGEVADGAGKTLLLEKTGYNGNWVTIDSTRIKDNGSFSISAESPASSEIYRLALGDRYVYFPIDSVESLTVKTSLADFGYKFSVEGTPQAEKMAEFDRSVLALNANDPAAREAFKRDVYKQYIQDSRGSILSYYVLTKFVNGHPLFDPTNTSDARFYAAVATQFQEYRPDDPHAEMLKQVSLDAMRKKASAQGKKTVIQAQELKIIDVSLPDENGKNVSLSDVAGKGVPTLVVFAMMNEEKSPAFNRELARIYNSRQGNLRIYHISVDDDHFAWREAAKNLPWTTVIDAGGISSDAALKYNVSSLPVFFIYDGAGNLLNRAEDFATLEKML